MKIPKEFKLLGQTIIVEYDNDSSHRDGTLGSASYTENKISIQPSNIGAKRTNEQVEHTFYHELVHHILNSMGEYELRNSEKFVETFSGLLHQFEQTKK